MEICDDFLEPKVSNFVKVQVQLSDRKSGGERYNTALKKFALSLYFLSPKCYRFLRTIFKLPSIETLNAITREWSHSEGLNDNLFNAIKIRVDRLEAMDRHVSLCVDEMSIKPNLFYNIKTDDIVGFNIKNKTSNEIECIDHVMVLMATGIKKRFKQPLAYYFSKTAYTGSELKDIIFNCIKKMTAAGFIVDCIISDMGSNFNKLSKDLNVSPTNPFFDVDGKKIYYIFDPPHLLKLTRNNLMSNYFEYDGVKTNWQFIQDFYNEDSKLCFRLAPKLTDDHLSPKVFKKMKVKFAAHIISSTVVAGMATHVIFNKLDSEALHTVEILDKFDKLFDIFNSSTFKTPKKYRKPYDGNIVQKMFLEYMLDFLDNIEVKHFDLKKNMIVDRTGKVSFLTGWRISISSLIALSSDLKESGFRFILARRLNQDPLENYFGTVRSQGGNCVNPTTIQFSRIFKKLFCADFIKHTGDGGNCEDDFSELLLNIKSMEPVVGEYIEEIQETKTGSDRLEFNSIQMTSNEFQDIDLITQNGLNYVSGYFAQKILKKHNCAICREDFLKPKNCNEDLNEVYINMRQFDDTKASLVVPKTNWTDFIKELENLLINNIELMYNPLVIFNLYQILIKTEFNCLCTSFPKGYFVKLFIRIRIYYIVLFINRTLKDKKAKNIKLLKLSNEI